MKHLIKLIKRYRQQTDRCFNSFKSKQWFRDINMIEHDKKDNNKNKNNNETDDIKLSNNAIKDHVKNTKINYSPKKTKSNDENVHKIQQEKSQIEIVEDSMANSTEGRGVNKSVSHQYAQIPWSILH